MTPPDPTRDDRLYFPADEISFLRSQDCCVCFVDMVNSTEVVARLADAFKIRRYYSLFLGSISTIARNFDAKIVKNAGDCLIFYFPKTSGGDREAFRNVLECGIAMIEAHPRINKELAMENLPPADYRISADHGRVEVAKSATSNAADLFGPTMNICAKINSKASKHGMVIGGDLYQIMRSLSLDEDYNFDQLSAYSVGFKYAYPVYAMESKKNRQPHSDVASANSLCGREVMMNIMVIDDEPDVLLTYQEFLASEGHSVDAFSDSTDALKRFAEMNPSHYDLVIMDIRMPKLNGLQLYQRFKAINTKIKIVFVSCLDAAEELITMLPDVKGNDIIRKPVDQEYFIRTVRSCAT